MYVAYFGEFVGMGEKPSIVPYTKIDQPGGRPDEIRTNFLLPKSLHEKIVKKPLDLDKIWIRRHVVEMNKMRMYLENILRSFKSDRYKVIFNHLRHMSHFAYACKMQYPLNLVLENIEYLWFYWTFCIVILDYGLKLHKLSNHTLVMLQKWLEIH